MIQSIVERYKGRQTACGHILSVETRPKGAEAREAFIWYRAWDETEPPPGNKSFGIARVRQEARGYRVGWFAGTETTPLDEPDLRTIEDVLAVLDEAIRNR
jgi:hypothetical protein